MKYLIFLIIPSFCFALDLPPIPFPIFLKQGFSSVLEFEEYPTQVVIGDSRSFQVEKLKKSVVIRALSPYAASNMFVYFKTKKPKLFILTSSEDANPTYYKKFETVIPKKIKTTPRKKKKYKRSTRLLKSSFDKRKDYLTLEIQITADSTEILKPKWNLVRLYHKKRAIAPFKLWSERKTVQKDSKVKARFIFAKPNVPRNLKNVSLIIPLKGHLNPVVLPMPTRLK